MPYEEIHNSLPISSIIFPDATYDEEPPSYSEAIKNFHPLESRLAHITWLEIYKSFDKNVFFEFFVIKVDKGNSNIFTFIGC